MKLTLENKIRVQGAPDSLKQRLVEQLLVPNPKYQEAVVSGRSLYELDQFITNFSILPDDSLLVPRGMRSWLLRNAQDVGSIEIEDNRKLFDYRIVDSSKIKYRPYQAKAVMDLVSTGSDGVLVAPAGSGKTVMGLSLIPVVGQPTLWLTHTGPLVQQATERAEAFLPDIGEIGLIGQGKWKIGDTLTIAIIQTLVRNLDRLYEMRDEFGMAIVDECLVAGTTILMIDGSIKDICDVENGEVTTFGKISNKFSRVVDKTIEIRGGWGKLEGSITHRLPIVKKSALKFNNKLPKQYDQVEENDVTMTTLSDVNMGDFVLVPEANCHTHRHNVGVPQELEEILRPNSSVRKVEYGGVMYRCMKILAKKEISEQKEVFDFTTEKHLFFANGVLSSNCHHVPSRTFTEVVSRLSTFYLYALTATPYRRDKLEALMFQYIGMEKTVIPIQEVKNYGGIIVPAVLVRKVPSAKIDGNNIQEILRDNIVENTSRNKMIIDDVIAEAKAGRFCIVISDRRKHCEYLYKDLKRAWPKTGIATGKYTKKQITKQVEAFNNNEITVLVATFSLLGEGFDVPFLDRAFITMPFRAEAKAEQLVGRIQRYFPGKKDAVVYDYVDSNIGVLNHQFRNSHRECRYRVYERLGVKVIY